MTGEELVSHIRLRFRSRERLTRSLTDAGFVVCDVFGDWKRRPVAPEHPELLFVAMRE